MKSYQRGWSIARSHCSLSKAIELIREQKSKIVSDVRQIGEKPGEGVISEKEALFELHKITQIQSAEISAKKPRKRGFPRRGVRPPYELL